MKGFFKDPSNLKYSLNTIVPLVVFLTSLLSVVIGANVLTSARTHGAWMWVVVVCLFSSLCAFVVVRAMIQPISDLVKQAEKFVKFEELRKERGQMIEVYNNISAWSEAHADAAAAILKWVKAHDDVLLASTRYFGSDPLAAEPADSRADAAAGGGPHAADRAHPLDWSVPSRHT